MKNRKIALGPGAASLILIVVVLSMSMMGMLTLISARNDESLSLRNAETITANYSAFSEAERTLATLDAVLKECREEAENENAYLELIADRLPVEVTLDEDVLSWEETAGERVLACAIRLLPMEDPVRFEWVDHRLVTAETEDDEWN